MGPASSCALCCNRYGYGTTAARNWKTQVCCPACPTFKLSTGAALIEAKAAGMSVIVKEAMANGRLTPRNTDPAAADRLKLLCDTAQQVRVRSIMS